MENLNKKKTAEDALMLKLAKPYKFDKKEYTEVDLHGLENTTAADLDAEGKILQQTPIMLKARSNDKKMAKTLFIK